MNNKLQARSVSKSYYDGKIEVKVLQDLNFTVKAHESVAIIGRSGSGKSTLLNLLGGLDVPTSGEIIVADKNLASLSQIELNNFRNTKLGFIFQSHHLLPEFSALENVCMPLFIRKDQKAKERGLEILAKVGLEKRAQYKPAELSGGERQRVAIARALIANPTVILADEPTGNLDEKSAIEVLELMLELTTAYNACLIVVTHDLAIAKRMNRQFTLSQGKLNLST